MHAGAQKMRYYSIIVVQTYPVRRKKFEKKWIDDNTLYTQNTLVNIQQFDFSFREETKDTL